MTTDHMPYGVEIGTAITTGGDYRVEEYATCEEALARIESLRSEGLVIGTDAEVGQRYALAVQLDHEGCPKRSL